LILIDIILYIMHRASGGILAGCTLKVVYACKSTDVTDVMVNGKWLMRDRQLTNTERNRASPPGFSIR